MKTIISEKLFEKKLSGSVLAVGGLCLKLIAVSFRGFPDRTIILPGGRVIFVELKSTGYSRTTPTQIRQSLVRRMLEKLGFKYYLIDSMESLNEFIISEL